MGHALYVPALGKHVYAHNASDMLARSPFRAYRVDHLAEYGAEKSPDRSSGERRDGFTHISPARSIFSNARQSPGNPYFD
jgi:hypothetical protein